jgi:hypothetical protein
MKAKIVLLIAPILFVLASCSESQVSPTSVNNTLKQGTWKVSFYWDTDHEETSDLDGYNFIFGANNVITANNGSTSVSGTWYVTESGDDSGDQTELVLNFGSALFPLTDLNEDWTIIEKSATRIHTRHDSGGGGGTDLLTFQKL